MPARGGGGRGTRRIARRLAPRSRAAGLTLIELIVAFSLLLILSAMSVPVLRVRIQREKEQRLRLALQEMRVAIDRHKDMADEGKLGELDPDNHGYPESLETLVEGVAMDASASAAAPGGLDAGGQSSASQSGGSGFGGGGAGGLGSQRSASSSFGSQRSGEGAFGSGQKRSPGGLFGGRDSLSGRSSDPFASEPDGPESIRFLRSIPVDPMTGQRQWGLQAISDEPGSRSWSGRNVFDVYSLSSGVALDGTRYSEW